MNSIGLGNSISVVDEQGDPRWKINLEEDADITIQRYNASGVLQEQVLELSATAGNVTLTGNLAITGDVAVTGSISSTGESDVSYRSVVNDGAVEIGRSDHGGVIEMLNTTTGTKSITTDTSGANAVALGQEVTLFLTAATGNSYTLALSTGTLTFNAALECAKIVRTSLGWNVVSLNGATIV